MAAWLACVLVVAPLAAAQSLPQGMSLAEAPAWVKPVDVTAVSPGAPSGGVAYRVVDDQVSLRGTRPHEYRLLAYDVVDRGGLEDGGRLRIGYQPDFQSVQLHGLQVIRDGRRSDRRAQARIELLRLEQRANDGILDGWRTAEILIPDVKVGDRVELSFSTLGSNPVLGDHYHRTFSAAYGTGTGLRRLRVLAGSGPLNWRRTGPVPYDETDSSDAGGRVLELVARDLPAIEHEAGAPDWFDGYGVLEVGTAPDWGSVADWAANLFRATPASRDRLAGQASELELAGKPADEALALALAFVQREVRYVSLSIGDSSHAPADPAVTLARRYGDCKDKSLLLVGLLAEAGVEAQPVLVNTRLGKRITDLLPGPNAFDHAIVRARVDGEWLYVDPTRDPELGTFPDRQPADFGHGLPVARGVSALDAFPTAGATPSPAVEVDQEMALRQEDDEYLVDIRIDTRYRYGFAASNRSRFAADGAAKVGRGYLEYMEGFYRGIEPTADPVAVDSPDDNRFEVSEQYRTGLDTEDVAPGQLGEFSLLLFPLGDWVPPARTARRAWPLHLPGPRHGVQEIRMSNDGGWTIEPEQHTVENDYFRFRREVSAEGKILTVRGEWHRLADHLPSEDYAEVREQLQEVRNLLEFSVVIGDAETPGPEITPADLTWPGIALLLLAMFLGTLWTVRDRSAVAGVFFSPRTTLRRLLDEGSIPLAMLWLLASAVLMLVLTAAPELVAGRSPAWGPVLLESLAEVPRYFLVAAVLMLVFRLFGHRPGFRGVLIVSAWSAIPGIVLLLLAWLAAGPLLAALAEPALMPHGSVPTIVAMAIVAFLLMLAAFAWWLVAGLTGLSEAAGSSIGIAFAVLFVTLATMFIVVFTLLMAYLLVSGELPGFL